MIKSFKSQIVITALFFFITVILSSCSQKKESIDEKRKSDIILKNLEARRNSIGKKRNPIVIKEEKRDVTREKGELGIVIKKIEDKFDQIKGKYRDKIDALKNKNTKDQVDYVFKIIEANKKNEYKNYFDYKGVTHDDFHCHHFIVYDFLPFTAPTIVSSAFNPLERIIRVRHDFNTSDIYSLVVLSHELSHSLQDSQMRDELSIERYLCLLKSGSQRSDIGSEMMAYGVGLEIGNMLMDGFLEKAAVDNKTIDYPKITKKYKIKTSDLMDLVALAREYFPREKNGFNPGFVKLVFETQEKVGVQLFYFDKKTNKVFLVGLNKDGTIQPIKEICK